MKKPSTPRSTAPAPLAVTLRLEGLALAGVCILIYARLGGGWGLFALLILAPDLFMLGYLRDRLTGALVYNIGHSYLTPLALAGAGLWSGSDLALSLALIWGAHIGLDRAMGYGLKYGTGFKATHLGRV